MEVKVIGPIAWYIGLLIAIAAAFIEPSGILYLALAIIGVVVGLLNITAKETTPFLLASTAFIVAAYTMRMLVGAQISLSENIIRLATNLVVLIGSGAMLIALKAIYDMAKGE
ncbi:MAG: hypothetical protein QXU01_00270 [Candidatus Hadarchaeales archaeon]